jgi:nucleoside-diphosphate-sugar epimerase
MMSVDSYDEETVLVTGGAGAIGSRLVRALRGRGATVVILDDFSSGYEFNIPDDIEVVRADVASSEAVREALTFNPSHVFHLAAFFANQNSVDHPHADLDTNGHGIITVLQECAAHDSVQRVIYSSSSCAYDENEELPYTESESVELTFNTPYEITKTLGEAYCNYFGTATDLEVVRARIFNSYGPGEVPGKYRNVIPNFVYLAMQNEPLPITGSGEETRDFTFVTDVASALSEIGIENNTTGEAINIATDTETTIDELARQINSIVGNGAGVIYEARRNWDQTDRRRGSIQKLNQLIGYEPSVPLRQGLKRTVEWFNANWTAIDSTAETPSERA